ncbi:hypothetical protein QR680_002102 [Steinernema hermaphroditum]|uniref:Uncharacterized protein n=1 Tax=Steinernema hermaphroditum TaxID=289476 RepID=A0AA39H1B8_9BILA|nr:hypothetical protein QR680_002102 [Steinernema hermaphroditum]
MVPMQLFVFVVLLQAVTGNDSTIDQQLTSGSALYPKKRIVFEALAGDVFLNGRRKLARALYSAFEKERRKDTHLDGTFREHKRPLFPIKSNFDVLVGGGLG